MSSSLQDRERSRPGTPVMSSSCAGSSQSCRPVMLVTGIPHLRLDSQVVIERGENLVGKTTVLLSSALGKCGNQGEEKDVSLYKQLNVLD
jgi:hypothetical protein